MSPIKDISSAIAKYEQLRLNKANRVRRNLFGPIDKDVNKIWVEKQLRDQFNKDCLKYNMDFKELVPMNVPNPTWKWEKVDRSLNHGSSVAMRGLRINSLDQPIEQNNNEQHSIQYVKTGDILTFRQRQSKITDYLQKRKRPISLNSPSTKRIKDDLSSSSSASNSNSTSSSSTEEMSQS